VIPIQGGTAMQPPDLAFFTSHELISELMRRKTFLGVVVHSEHELKATQWPDEQNFKVQFNSNLTAEKVSRLFSKLSEYIDLNHS
jgi:hypothetical protein